jgi:hypothetical protein
MPRAAGLVLVALVAALVLPTSVMAAKADRYTDTSTQLWCSQLRSDAGTAYVSAWHSDRGETFADLGFWAAPATRETSPVTWAGWSNAALMSTDGSTLAITFGVYGLNEGDVDDPSDLVLIGDGTLTALLTPVGDAETFGGNDQYGNHHFRSSSSYQAYEVSGSLELPTGISFDLADCQAFRTTDEWFNNNPANSVSRASELQVSCVWSTKDGSVGLVASETAIGTKADLWVETTDNFIFGSGSVSLSRSAFEATFDLHPKWDESESAGTATASAALTELDRVSQSEVFGDSRFTVKGLLLGVAGSLTVETTGGTTSLDMDDTSCQAGDVRFSEFPSRPERPEPVANDTPDTAIPVKLFDKLFVSTAGTDKAPEAACLLDDGEGGTFEGDMTNTVWWRLEGTGSSITIDTGGSTFDTMVAVYLVEDGVVGAQVGCVDDVGESLQALITFDTAGDASYLVQTGGFGGETGDLALVIYEP